MTLDSLRAKESNHCFETTDFMISALVRWTRPTDMKLSGDNGLSQRIKTTVAPHASEW